MENRNYKMCHGRYQKILKGLKEVWSPEEDEKIKTFISVHGKKWKKISQELPGKILI